MPEPDRQLLRKQIRQLRRAVPEATNLQHSLDICQRILAGRVYAQSSHIAFFIAADGELSLEPLLNQAHEAGKSCYLPVSATDGSWTLGFYPYAPGDALRKTALGVLEPEKQPGQIEACDLDLVLTPLVAFDENCYRMGMGKGYYDRTFAFKNPKNARNPAQNSASSPKLVGIAHECQKMESLQSQWWDVPLDAVLTPQRIYGDESLF